MGTINTPGICNGFCPAGFLALLAALPLVLDLLPATPYARPGREHRALQPLHSSAEHMGTQLEVAKLIDYARLQSHCLSFPFSEVKV